MLDQVVDFFKIDLDFKLNLMTANQSINSLSSKILIGIDKVYLLKNLILCLKMEILLTPLVSVAFHQKNKILY